MRFLFLFLLLLVAFLSVSSAHAFDETSTREEILESRRRRKVQLEAMLKDAQLRLDEHVTGRKVLTADEIRALEKKVDIFSRKLETMQDDLNDMEIERIMTREKLRNDRIKERRGLDEL